MMTELMDILNKRSGSTFNFIVPVKKSTRVLHNCLNDTSEDPSTGVCPPSNPAVYCPIQLMGYDSNGETEDMIVSNVESSSYEIIQPPDGLNPSDHLPVMATFTLSK